MPRAEQIELQDPSGSVMADLQAGARDARREVAARAARRHRRPSRRATTWRGSRLRRSRSSRRRRGAAGPSVPESEVQQGENAAAQFLIRWRGEADPRHVKAVDTYWVSAAEHGLNASTFTARIAASTGADCAAAMSAAVGALSGPLHGGAPTRVLEDARRGRGERRRRRLRPRPARARRADHGLRPSRLPRRGSTRARAPPDGARSSARRGSRSRRRSSARRSRPCVKSTPTGRSRRTSSSGPPSCSRSPRSRLRCTPRCSAAPASPAGRRTSSSSSAPAG